MDEIQSYLQDVAANMQTTWPQYEVLRPKARKYPPVPFFGDVKHARVLTVGVNPSASEFVNRAWPEVLTVTELNERLRNYFLPDPVGPYKWFETWSRALALLGVSYEDGAAHIDLSSRVTVSMGGADRELFNEMVEQDIQWFFKLITQCSKVRLLLFAGCVTKASYIDNFLTRVAPRYGFQFEGQATTHGKARTGFYCLSGRDTEIAAFFCSVSPSARTLLQRQMLIDRVQEHRQNLLGLMDRT